MLKQVVDVQWDRKTNKDIWQDIQDIQHAAQKQ
jgi:hypothetical protein